MPTPDEIEAAAGIEPVDEVERKRIWAAAQAKASLEARAPAADDLRLADFTTVTRARTIAEHTDAEDTVAAIACELLTDYDPPQPVRLLGVRMASFEDETSTEGSAPDLEDRDQMALPL